MSSPRFRVNFRYEDEAWRKVADLAAEDGIDVSAVARQSLKIFCESGDWRAILRRRAEVRLPGGVSRAVLCSSSLRSDVVEWLAVLGSGLPIGALAAAGLDCYAMNVKFRRAVVAALPRLTSVRPCGSVAAPVCWGVLTPHTVVLEMEPAALCDLVAALEVQREAFAVQAYCGEDDVTCAEDQAACLVDQRLWLSRAFNVDRALRQLARQLESLGDGPNESC